MTAVCGVMCVERHRARGAALYDLFFAMHQRMQYDTTMAGSGTDQRPEELVWGIGTARWGNPRGKLHHAVVALQSDNARDV